MVVYPVEVFLIFPGLFLFSSLEFLSACSGAERIKPREFGIVVFAAVATDV